MMKSLILILSSVLLVSGDFHNRLQRRQLQQLQILAKSKDLTLECAYQISDFKLYTCVNLNLKTKTSREDRIVAVKGVHATNKTNKDVTSVYFLSSEMKKIPRDLFKVFPSLLRVAVQGLDVQGKFLNKDSLSRGVFEDARRLTTVIITGTLLEDLKGNIFEGAQNLRFLSLESNGIRTIDSNAFNGLKNLKTLSLNYNLIKSFNEGTFDDLISLETLSMSGNYISEIDPMMMTRQENLKSLAFVSNVLEVVDVDSFGKLPELEEVAFEQNVCVDKNFGDEQDEVTMLDFKRIAGQCTEENRLKTRLDNANKRLHVINLFIGNLTGQIPGGYDFLNF